MTSTSGGFVSRPTPSYPTHCTAEQYDAMYARSIELIGSNRAGLFMNLVPIFGSIFAVLLLGETFHIYHGMALALVVGGIAIAQNLTPKFY